MIRGPERKAERSGGPFCSDGVKRAVESSRRPADRRRRYAQTPDGVAKEPDKHHACLTGSLSVIISI